MANGKRQFTIMMHALSGIGLLMALLVAHNVHGDELTWTGAVDNDFFNAGNWSGGTPSTEDDVAVIDGGANLPAVIGGGDLELCALRLGEFDAGGSLTINGGTLTLVPDALLVESLVGGEAPDDSSLVLNNNAVILYDDPLGGRGNGLNSDGTGKDFDVGFSVPEGALGRLELHDSSVLRISDDLKLAEGSGGHAAVTLDGNSKITVGSGISSSGVSQIYVAGNSLLVTGNSADPGDSQQGRTNEGYLTLSTGSAEESILEVSENGRVYARTLQQRGGLSTITLRDDAQFHVFDVFDYAGPSLGNATVVGSAQGPQRTSHVSQGDDAETIIQLFDRAIMTIDSDLEDATYSGLAVSGGNNRGANTDSGGSTLIEVHDQATFAVQQDLNLTLGRTETATSTLKVKGADATVTIGGDLRMAIDELEDPNPGTAILQAVITSASHSTVTVGGTAFIENADLLVELDGYTPVGGEMYPLLSAAQVQGTEFRSTSLPALAAGLSWDLIIGATTIDLLVQQPGDYNRNGQLDAGDLDLQASVGIAQQDLAYDLNQDGVVNFDGDRVMWLHELKKAPVGDADLNGSFTSDDFVTVFIGGLYETGSLATWEEGDWNGDLTFDSNDFVAAFIDGYYEQQNPLGGAGVASVPEPASLLSLLLGFLAIWWRRR